MIVVRLVRPVDAVAVELIGLNVGQVAVPDLVGLLGQYDLLRLLPGVRPVEEAEFDLGGVFG